MADLCSSLISRFPIMLLRYFLNDAEMVLDVPIIFYIIIIIIIITSTDDFNNWEYTVLDVRIISEKEIWYCVVGRSWPDMECHCLDYLRKITGA